MILQNAIIRHHGEGAVLAQAVGRDVKGKLSIVAYISGAALAFVSPLIADAIYAAVAVMWLVPDKRIDNALKQELSSHHR
jgi:hypothetical protein